MPISDFIRYHLREAVHASVAELDGDEDLARRLHAQTKLRLICMTDEELWELAKQTSFHKRVELVYKGYKQKIEELKATFNEWMNGATGNIYIVGQRKIKKPTARSPIGGDGIDNGRH